MKLKKLLEYDHIVEFRKLLVTNFEVELFVASLRNYCSHGNPLRFHNFAFSMRELVLQVIDRKAPDDEVKIANWYVKESSIYEVTRRQKLKFCAQGYLSDKFLDRCSLADLDLKIKGYLNKFNFFNKYTHITEKHFKPDPLKFYTDMKYIIELSRDVIEGLSCLEGDVISNVENNIRSELFDSIVNDFPTNLDILANNVIIEQIEPEKIDILDINDTNIDIEVSGTVYVSQEYGKGDDFLAMACDYPFTISLTVSVNDPSDITVDMSSLEVDTSSWFGDEDSAA
ncbi:hypothetical protein M5215_004308 [Vibrio vulnificus]|nr:hypothetical protein [Vibrio vulnificus]EJE8540540.1 hypothetical protein [Vibrio vulnificus]EKA7343405.1 hypothetical protein [Vibrio vulnificus]EKD9327821.1 hypothetical protein [Vibrio vulnificus]ELQ2342432.1 hypothetical protein [Vibrio vulnificus]